jgi:hypothetical protein
LTEEAHIRRDGAEAAKGKQSTMNRVPPGMSYKKGI